MRIALIHALRHSPPPIEAAFRALWPAPDLMNLLDDSLSADLARIGHLTQAMTERFLALAGYAIGTGANGILFTCSAFGPCIDAVKARYPAVPVLKPSEAMIEEAVALGGPVALLATFAPTLRTMPSEFPPAIEVRPLLVEGAMAALDAGRREEHDRLVLAALEGLAGCKAIALAQFSLARAQAIVGKATGRPPTAKGYCAMHLRVERSHRKRPPVSRRPSS